MHRTYEEFAAELTLGPSVRFHSAEQGRERLARLLWSDENVGLFASTLGDPSPALEA